MVYIMILLYKRSNNEIYEVLVIQVLKKNNNAWSNTTFFKGKLTFQKDVIENHII